MIIVEIAYVISSDHFRKITTSFFAKFRNTGLSLFFNFGSGCSCQHNGFAVGDREPICALLIKSVWRADVHTDPAKYTGKRIVGPGGGFFIDPDALRGAFYFTNTTESAFFDIVKKRSPAAFKRRSHHPGISPCGFGAKQIFEYIGRHLKHWRIPPFTFPYS